MRSSRSGLFAAGLTIAAVSFLVGLEHPLRTLEAPKGMVSFQLAGTADVAARIVADWQREGVVGRARGSLVVDYPFLLGYSTVLALLALWLRFRDWTRFGRFAPLATGLAAASALLFVAAGLCDALENVLLLRELAAAPTDVVAGRAAWLARLKLHLLKAGGLSIAVLACLHARHVQRQFPLLQYLYFCRFPLLTAAALLTLPAFCVLGLPVLLRNLFAVEGAGLIVVSALAFLLAWTTLLTVANILRYAELRLGVAAPPGGLLEWLYQSRSFVAGFLAAPILIVAVSYETGAWVPQLLAAAAGLAAAFLILIVAELLQQFFGGPIHKPQDRVFDSGLGRWLQSSARATATVRLPAPRAWVARVSGLLGPGYEQDGHLLPGHFFATVFFAVSAALYFALYVPLRPDRPLASLPALAYVLMLLTVVSWLLPGASFYIDRSRMPVLLTLVVALFMGSALFKSDRFYRMFPPSAEEPAPPLPLKALERNDRQLGAQHPIVVVAASGGGIRAALWTVQVLTALQDPEAVGPDFPRAIRLISSVSGGSVGTLFYLDSYQAGAPDAARALDDAGVNALDAAAWGIAYPDLWRTFLPGVTKLTGRFLDRGWALEEVWRRRLSKPEARLSDWRRLVAEGTLPPAVLNATLAETGEQLLFTPLEVPRPWNANSLRLSDGLYDIGLSTAARLSASFPWVSPMATAAILDLEGREVAATERPGPHVADGGYYDNFGVVTAVHWIETVLCEGDPQLGKRGVLLVVISASPLGREEMADLPPGRRDGSFYDTVGPLALLARVRDATQLARNRLELDLLKEKWRALGARLSYVIFEPAAPGPLSWKLTAGERQHVLDAWSRPPNPDRLAELKRCFTDMASCEGEPKPPAPPAPDLLGDIPAQQAR